MLHGISSPHLWYILAHAHINHFKYAINPTHPGSIPVSGGHYGNVSAEILLDDVVCEGSESSLLMCGHAGLGVHNCNPETELAGVRCGGMIQLSDLCKCCCYPYAHMFEMT